MKGLEEWGKECGTDKGTLHNYLGVYEALLGWRRAVPGVLVEFGVQSGASLRMWARWLPLWKIIGIDVRGIAVDDWPDNVFVYWGDCRMGPVVGLDRPDVVIDDASHERRQIADAYTVWWPFVKAGGLYVVEDVHKTRLNWDQDRMGAGWIRMETGPGFDDMLMVKTKE